MVCRVTFALIGSVLIAGCSGSKDSAPTPVGETKTTRTLPVMVDKLPLTAPEGWKINAGKGSPEMMMGPVVGGVQTIVSLTVEPFAGTLEQFEDARLKDLEERYIEFELLARKDFATKGNIKGIKSAIVANLFQKKMRMTYYVFDGPEDKKYVFSCAVKAANGEEFDKKFDEIIATYKP